MWSFVLSVRVLVLFWRLPNGEQVLTKTAFETGTGQAVRLRLPVGYDAQPTESFALFEWLDDDTVVLAAGGLGNGPGNILACDLPDGRCSIAVDDRRSSQSSEEVPRRILPHLPLPG